MGLSASSDVAGVNTGLPFEFYEPFDVDGLSLLKDKALLSSATSKGAVFLSSLFIVECHCRRHKPLRVIECHTEGAMNGCHDDAVDTQPDIS